MKNNILCFVFSFLLIFGMVIGCALTQKQSKAAYNIGITSLATIAELVLEYKARGGNSEAFDSVIDDLADMYLSGSSPDVSTSSGRFNNEVFHLKILEAKNILKNIK